MKTKEIGMGGTDMRGFDLGRGCFRFEARWRGRNFMNVEYHSAFLLQFLVVLRGV